MPVKCPQGEDRVRVNGPKCGTFERHFGPGRGGGELKGELKGDVEASI